MMESHFSAGIAKVDISPSQADIDAYRTLGKEQFKSLKQKLYARVIAFRDDRTGRISIILGSDLINVPDYFMIRQRLAEKFGIKPTDMILGGTQNHASIVSDPPDFKPDERPDILLHVRDEIHNGIEKAVGIALSDMKKAVLGFGTTPSVIGVNKDETLKEGRPSGANLNMQEDHDLFILLVKDLEGRPMAAMLNYGMQGVYYSTMTDSYISGDIHGAVSEKLESFYGEDFIAPYLIGASGDKNPVLNALPQVFHFKDGVMTNVSSLVKNDQCISLEPYRDVYPEVFNMFPEGAYKACQVGGVQYSLPVSDTFCSFEYYAMRKDVAEEIGVMELVDTKITLEQLDEIMLKAKAAHPDMSWVNDLNAPTLQGIDNLGNDAAIGVLMNRGADATEVVNYYETAEWKTYIEMAKDWEAKGYFMDDPLNNPAIPGDLVKNGLMGGFFGEAATLTDAYTNVGMFVPGYDLVIFQLTDMGATNSCVGGGWQVSSICQNPDEAMKLLALMYTDETIARLFGNGVEGKQYKLDENGCAWYADGKDASNCGWHCTAPWFYPNKALVYPFETTDVNANKGDAACWNAEGMTFSKGMGFIFDDSAVRDEYAACASTVAEYRAALMYGQVDLEETNAQFVSELKENGIDDIIAEMNRQFTDFCNAG